MGPGGHGVRVVNRKLPGIMGGTLFPVWPSPCAEAGKTIRNVDAIGVGLGPGSIPGYGWG